MSTTLDEKKLELDLTLAILAMATHGGPKERKRAFSACVESLGDDYDAAYDTARHFVEVEYPTRYGNHFTFSLTDEQRDASIKAVVVQIAEQNSKR